MTIIALIHKDDATTVPREVADMDAARALAAEMFERGMTVSMQGAEGPVPIVLDATLEAETEEAQAEAPAEVVDAAPAESAAQEPSAAEAEPVAEQ